MRQKRCRLWLVSSFLITQIIYTYHNSGINVFKLNDFLWHQSLAVENCDELNVNKLNKITKWRQIIHLSLQFSFCIITAASTPWFKFECKIESSFSCSYQNRTMDEDSRTETRSEVDRTENVLALTYCDVQDLYGLWTTNGVNPCWLVIECLQSLSWSSLGCF